MKLRPALLAAWTLALVVHGRGAPAEFAHLGPVETLDNGVVTVQVAPRVGRIVAYHRPAEANWLAVNDAAPTPGIHWNPWGGDRVWPTAQLLCPQIYKNTGFDPVIDGQPWEIVAKTPTSLELRSGVSPWLNLQVTRCIELVAGSTEVRHTFTLRRTAPSAFPVHVWTVTGVRAGDFMLMESDPRVVHFGFEPYRDWPELGAASPDVTLLAETRTLHVPWPAVSQKLGTYGRWIALVSGSSAFAQFISYDPSRLYLEASTLQAYFDPSQSLFELETVSPAWSLQAGETATWTVRWRLLELPADAGASVHAQADFIQSRLPHSPFPQNQQP